MASSPSLALDQARLEEISKERCSQCIEKDTTITLPKVHMSILAWLQVVSILVTGLYFIFSHINEAETSNAVIRQRQAALSKRLENVEVKLDTVSDDVHKLDGKIDVLLLMNGAVKK